MDVGALSPYEDVLRDGSSGVLHLGDAAPEIALDVERWLQPADDVDLAALRGLAAPVLDIGCGPGRIVEALTSAGTLSLGIDIAGTAVMLARARGLNALRRDVFGALPHEGRWSAAVLLDGNIGIGGDPVRLLARVAELLRPDARLLVETNADATADNAMSVRFWLDHRPIGPSFRWAVVGEDALRRHAAGTGFAVLRTWRDGGRAFALLASGPRDTDGLADSGR